MKITAIGPQARNINRVNVKVDGKYALSLDIAQVVDLGVKVGQEIDEARLDELVAASNFGKVYARTLEWVLMRPRSEQEIRDYLRRKKDVGAGAVMERLRDRGYIDDEKFARYWVENRFVKKGVSKRRLELELRGKGVNDEMRRRVLDESERSDRVEAEKIATKKRSRYSDEELVQYLVRQGFGYGLAKEVVEEVVGEVRG